MSRDEKIDHALEQARIAEEKLRKELEHLRQRQRGPFMPFSLWRRYNRPVRSYGHSTAGAYTGAL